MKELIICFIFSKMSNDRVFLSSRTSDVSSNIFTTLLNTDDNKL